MKPIKFRQLFEAIPFIRQIPLAEKKSNPWENWADFIDNPEEGWEIPEGKTPIRYYYDEMFEGGILKVQDVWADHNGLHFHSRFIAAFAAPYILHIFGRDIAIPGRVTDRRVHSGHVVTWEQIKYLLEKNEIEVDLDKIELPERDEEDDDWIEEMWEGEVKRYHSYSKLRFNIWFRAIMFRFWLTNQFFRLARYLGKMAAPATLRRSWEKKNETDQG
jgi:hypothetical protein